MKVSMYTFVYTFLTICITIACGGWVAFTPIMQKHSDLTSEECPEQARADANAELYRDRYEATEADLTECRTDLDTAQAALAAKTVLPPSTPSPLPSGVP